MPMYRLYITRKLNRRKAWIPVGWCCRSCKAILLEASEGVKP